MGMVFQATRLLKLADYLQDRVPDSQFDQSHWFSTLKKSDGSDWDVDKDEEADAIHAASVITEDGHVNNMCGTSACALGHAALMPEFMAEGLRLVPDGEETMTATVKYGQYHAGDAGMRFFGVAGDDISNLFGGTDMTPQEKAKQIRDIVSLRMTDDYNGCYSSVI